MTDMAKTTLWVIIILVLVGGIWWFVGSKSAPEAPAPAPVTVQQATTTDQAPVVEDASTSISVQDKTDEALDSDLNKVDGQLKDLNANSSN